MSRRKQLAILLLPLMIVFGVMLLPASANASQDRILGELCSDEARAAQLGAECDDDEANEKVRGIVQRIINTTLWVAGIVSVIVLIIGAMKYVFSAGDAQTIAEARNMIIYAIVGAVVAFAGNLLVDAAFKEAEKTTPGTTIGLAVLESDI